MSRVFYVRVTNQRDQTKLFRTVASTDMTPEQLARHYDKRRRWHGAKSVEIFDATDKDNLPKDVEAALQGRVAVSPQMKERLVRNLKAPDYKFVATDTGKSKTVKAEEVKTASGGMDFLPKEGSIEGFSDPSMDPAASAGNSKRS